MPYDLSACGQVTICNLITGYGNNTITTGNDGGGVDNLCLYRWDDKPINAVA